MCFSCETSKRLQQLACCACTRHRHPRCKEAVSEQALLQAQHGRARTAKSREPRSSQRSIGRSDFAMSTSVELFHQRKPATLWIALRHSPLCQHSASALIGHVFGVQSRKTHDGLEISVKCFSTRFDNASMPLRISLLLTLPHAFLADDLV